MKNSERFQPSPKSLPFEESLSHAFGIYLWRTISVLIVFWFITIGFWIVQIITIGLSAFTTDLFTLAWGTGGGLSILIFAAIMITAERRMIIAVGLSGWINFYIGKWGIKAYLFIAVSPVYLARILPVPPFDIKLVKLSGRLQLRFFYYILDWLDIPLKLATVLSYDKEDEETKRNLQLIREGKDKFRELIIANRKMMKKLERTEKERGAKQRQDTKELIHTILVLFSSLPTLYSVTR